MKTTTEIVETAKARSPSDEANGRIALCPFNRDELLAALKSVENNQRATDLLTGVEAASANSVLYVQREHLIEALANEPADL